MEGSHQTDCETLSSVSFHKYSTDMLYENYWGSIRDEKVKSLKFLICIQRLTCLSATNGRFSSDIAKHRLVGPLINIVQALFKSIWDEVVNSHVEKVKSLFICIQILL